MIGIGGGMAAVFLLAWALDFAVLLEDRGDDCLYWVPFRTITITRMVHRSGGRADIACHSLGLPDELIRLREELRSR
jgi:hypothetical protein